MLTLLFLFQAAASGQVQTVGEQRQVMREGDLRGRIELRTLAGRPNLYALGPLAGLRGEVTIGAGEASISRVAAGGGVEIDRSFDHSATFLVYAEVGEWRQSSLPVEVRGLRDLERYIGQAAKAAGIMLEEPFVFRLTGRAPRVAYHIVDKRDDAAHTAADHKKIQKVYTLEQEEVEIIGFWSNRHHGVFTHHGDNIHVHVRTRDRRHAGHVDEARLGGGMVLHLPAAGR